MADVIGPNSYLPGHIAPLPEDAVCDTHPNRLAVKRIVGECGSFGSELHDLCQECVNETRRAPPIVGTCDWCKTSDVELKHRRDYEEGSCGRVYEICQSCIKKDNDRIADDLMEDNDGSYFNEDEWFTEEEPWKKTSSISLR